MSEYSQQSGYNHNRGRGRGHGARGRGRGRGGNRGANFQQVHNQFAEDIDRVPDTLQSNDRRSSSIGSRQSVSERAIHSPANTLQMDSAFAEERFFGIPSRSQEEEDTFDEGRFRSPQRQAYDTVQDNVSQYQHRTFQNHLPRQSHPPDEQQYQHTRGNSRGRSQSSTPMPVYHDSGKQSKRGGNGQQSRGGHGSTLNVQDQSANHHGIQKPQKKRRRGGKHHKKPHNLAEVLNAEVDDDEDEDEDKDNDMALVLASTEVVKTPNVAVSHAGSVAMIAPGSIAALPATGWEGVDMRSRNDMLFHTLLVRQQQQQQQQEQRQMDEEERRKDTQRRDELAASESRRKDEMLERILVNRDGFLERIMLNTQQDNARASTAKDSILSQQLAMIQDQSQQGQRNHEGYATNLASSHNNSLQFAQGVLTSNGSTLSQSFAMLQNQSQLGQRNMEGLLTNMNSAQNNSLSLAQGIAHKSLAVNAEVGSNLSAITTAAMQVPKSQTPTGYMNRLTDMAEIERRKNLIGAEIDQFWRGDTVRNSTTAIVRKMSSTAHEWIPLYPWDYLKTCETLVERMIEFRNYVDFGGQHLRSSLLRLETGALQTIRTTSNADAAKRAMESFNQGCDGLLLSAFASQIIQDFDDKIRSAYILLWPCRDEHVQSTAFIEGFSSVRHALTDMFKEYVGIGPMFTSITLQDLEQVQQQSNGKKPLAMLHNLIKDSGIQRTDDPRYVTAITLRNSILPHVDSEGNPDPDYFQTNDYFNWETIGLQVSPGDETSGRQLQIDDGPTGTGGRVLEEVEEDRNVDEDKMDTDIVDEDDISLIE